MSRLKDLFGIGGAEIDARIDGKTIQPGGAMTGVVSIVGGDREQDLRGLRLEFQCVAERETDDGEYHVTKRFGGALLPDDQKVEARQELEVPFSIAVPFECPPNRAAGVDFHGIRLSLATRLDIAGARDAQDLDTVTVTGLPCHEATLHAMDRLGYALHSADVEEGFLHGAGRRSSLGVYAEYEYRGRGAVKEVEVSFIAGEHQTAVVVEKDKKARFGIGGGDRTFAFVVPTRSDDVEGIAGQLGRFLG